MGSVFRRGRIATVQFWELAGGDVKPGPKHSRVVKLIVSPGRYVIGNNVDHAVSEGKTKKKVLKE